MRSMPKFFKRAILVILCVGGLIVLLLWMQGTIGPRRVRPGLLALEQARPLPPGARVAAAREVEVEQWSEAVGTVKSKVIVTAASRIMAHVLEVRVSPGDHVKAGDVLVLLDNRELQAQLNKAQSALLAARAHLVQSDSHYNRLKREVAANAATPADLEVAEANLKIAQSEVTQAEDGVHTAEVNLGYTTITSPISGVVLEKRVEAGDLAIPGQALVVLDDPAKLRLEAAVPEGMEGSIKVSDRVKVRIDALNLELDATVDEIVPAADPLSRSFLVKASLPYHQGLRPGMFGRLFFAPKKTPVLCIPAKAVHVVGQLTTVDAIVDGGMHTRLIQTGRTYGDLIEVLSGLEAGEKVAVE